MPRLEEGEVVITLVGSEDAAGWLDVQSYTVVGACALVCMEDTARTCLGVCVEDTERTCLGIDPSEGTSEIQIGFCRIRYC